jgi:hypothetical protein
VSLATASLLSWAAASAGFALLSLTMARHANQVLGGLPRQPRRRLALVAGWSLVAASLACCLQGMSWGNALATWPGVLTLAALPLPLCLGWRPRMALVAGPLAALCAAGLLSLAS